MRHFVLTGGTSDGGISNRSLPHDHVLKRRHKPLITRHVTYRLPVIGRIAREVVEGEVDNSFALIIMVVSAVASTVLIWGFPALIISALGATALMFLTLLRITFG